MVTEALKTVDQGDAERPAGAAARDAQSDLTPFVPEQFVLAYHRRRDVWTSTDTAAFWLLAAHLLLLLVIVGRGAFYLDDLRAQGYALNQPFLDFIVGSNGTHFAPLPRTLDWLQSRLFPLQHGPAVAVTLVVRLLLALGFWRILRRLFGPRPATLIPFAMLLLTAALLPATTYYRQSITALAATAAIVWALDAHLRWVLYRRRGDLVMVALVTAIGLACYEKAATIPVILLAVTLVLFAGSAGPQAGATRAGRPAPVRAGLIAALLSAVVVLIFLVIYRTGPYDQGPSTTPSVLDVLDLTADTVTNTVIPLLLGGPFEWSYPSPYAGVPILSGTAVAFSVLIALIGTAAALWRRPGPTVRALLLLVAWTVPSVVVVAVGRFEELGTQLALEVRLWADLVPGFLLVGALATLPWRVGVHRSRERRREPAAPRTAADPTGPIELSVSALAGGLVVLLVLAGSVFSSMTYASKWWDNPTGLWIANARSSLENAEPFPRTLATPLPPALMPAFVSLTFPTDAPLLLLLRPDVRFHDADGDSKTMNASGVRSGYLPSVLAQTSTKKLCAAALPAGGAPVTVRLPAVAPYVTGAQVELGLLLAESTKVEVTVTNPKGKVLTPQRFSNDVLPKGPHTIRFPVPYLESVRSISVRVDGTKTSCVAYARVWAPLT